VKNIRRRNSRNNRGRSGAGWRGGSGTDTGSSRGSDGGGGVGGGGGGGSGVANLLFFFFLFSSYLMIFIIRKREMKYMAQRSAADPPTFVVSWRRRCRIDLNHPANLHSYIPLPSPFNHFRKYHITGENGNVIIKWGIVAIFEETATPEAWFQSSRQFAFLYLPHLINLFYECLKIKFQMNFWNITHFRILNSFINLF